MALNKTRPLSEGCVFSAASQDECSAFNAAALWPAPALLPPPHAAAAASVTAAAPAAHVSAPARSALPCPPATSAGQDCLWSTVGPAACCCNCVPAGRACWATCCLAFILNSSGWLAHSSACAAPPHNSSVRPSAQILQGCCRDNRFGFCQHHPASACKQTAVSREASQHSPGILSAHNVNNQWVLGVGLCQQTPDSNQHFAQVQGGTPAALWQQDRKGTSTTVLQT